MPETAPNLEQFQGTHVGLRVGDQIAEALATAIIEGQLAPGTRLGEVDVAEAFRTSRTPVREAIRILEMRGLLRMAPRRGAWVTELSTGDALGVYLCRSRIHSLGARLACEAKVERVIEVGRTAMETMRQAADMGDTRMYFHANVEFHDRLIDLAGNGVLARAAQSLGPTSLRFRYLSLTFPGRIEESAAFHERLMEALEDGNGAQAEDIVRTLIASAGISVLENAFKVTEGTASDLPLTERGAFAVLLQDARGGRAQGGVGDQQPTE